MKRKVKRLFAVAVLLLMLFAMPLPCLAYTLCDAGEFEEGVVVTECNTLNAPLIYGTSLSNGEIAAKYEPMQVGIALRQDDFTPSLNIVKYNTGTLSEYEENINCTRKYMGIYMEFTGDLCSDAALSIDALMSAVKMPEQNGADWRIKRQYADFYVDIELYERGNHEEWVDCDTFDIPDDYQSYENYSELSNTFEFPANGSVWVGESIDLVKIVLTADFDARYKLCSDTGTEYQDFEHEIVMVILLSNDHISTPVTPNAEKNPGEDKGVSINKGILDDDDSDTAGAVGGAAAVGVGVGVGVGVAAASSKKKKKKKKEEEEKEKKKTSYKMYVYKDFGDSIQKKAKAVRVCARIARVEDGKEYDDSHLTSYIHPSVNGLVLESYGMSGRYMAAVVSADENAGNSGSVTFTLRTETGVFNRQIIFHIVSDPYIHFVDENADGTLTPLGNSASFGAILGDKFEYSLKIYLRDAVEEPVRFDTQSENNNFEIRIEPTDKLYLYRAIFKNRTNEPERNEIFTKILKEVQNIVAVFKNGYEAECYAIANLFPEGLSVRAEHVENDRIPVKCYEMEKWNHERFSGEKFWLTLAVKTDKGAKILSPLEDGVSMDIGKKLSGDTRLNDPDSDKVAEKYTYKIDPDVDGQFYFIPKDYLYQPKKDTLYGAVLDASCTYKGVRYERYIPFRLIGAPPDPMGNWEEEYKRANRIIEKFSLPGEKTKWVLMLEDRSTDPRCSVAELRLFNKHILDKYMTYWTKQNEEDLKKVAYYDNIINTLEWAKFFGDCAFSYLMTVFTGPVAEAIITPSKDIFVYCLGEYIACINRGESFDYKNLEIVKSLDTAGDNVAAYITTEGVKKNLGMALANIKKMAYYIAGYYVVTVFRNYTAKYLEKGESDWYGAILSAFKDLTANAFKIIAGELFMKWINSKSFQEKVGKALQTWLTDKFRIRFKHTYKVKLNTYDVNISKKGVTITELPDKLTLKTKIDIKSPNKTTNVEMFQKYLTELCGVGVGYVFDQTSAKIKGEIDANRLYMSPTGPKYCFCIWDNGVTEPIYCELDLIKVVTYSANPMGPFTFLFDSLFGKLIGAPSAVEFPKDPPYSKTYMENKRSQEQAAASYRKMFDEKVSYPDSDSFGNYGSFGDTGSSGDYDNSGGTGDLC